MAAGRTEWNGASMGQVAGARDEGLEGCPLEATRFDALGDLQRQAHLQQLLLSIRKLEALQRRSRE